MHRLVREGDGEPDPTPGPPESALLALLLALSVGAAAVLAWQSVTADRAHFAGLTFDRLSGALTLLVGSVGAVAFRFSQHYLRGEPGQRRFLRWLTVTAVAAYVLMLASHLLVLFAAWSLTSFGLHQLLTFYRDRVEARRPARKKFLISRLGDLALLAAIVLVWREWGTFDLHEFLRQAAAAPAAPAPRVVGLLVVLAALTKSAQFPFHSWLPETMEAPTPVSALMHAGVINAGGALLLRFAPLLARVPEALFALALVGSLTVVVGMLAMWAQVKVKRTLAWSTVSQMGFMMVQCGVAAFPAALLHILGHGFYKAWAFLRSGEVPPPAPPGAQLSPWQVLPLVGLGVTASLPAMAVASWATGFSPAHSPGELALSAVLALAAGQVWVACLGQAPAGWPHWLGRLAGAALTTVAGVGAAFTLYHGAGLFLRPVLGDLPPATGALAWAAAVLPVLALAGLTVVQACLPTIGQTAAGRAWHVHALHGFYCGAVADVVVDTVWNQFVPRTEEVARA